MNILVLACRGVSSGGGGLTAVSVLHLPDYNGIFPPPDLVPGLVTVFPLVLDWYPEI